MMDRADELTAERIEDDALLEAVRRGDRSAYGELWRRHADAGIAFARYSSPAFDADDLVAEAYARILRTLSAGGGPDRSFRSYLYTTIRNTAYSWQRVNHIHQPLDLAEEVIPDQRMMDVFDALDGSPSIDAFDSLPTAWREVLWYVDVEGMPAAQVARVLRVTPNAVAARTYRAREGLRQAWIQVQLDPAPGGAEHQWAFERMGAYVRNGLSRRDRLRLQRHLGACVECSLVHVEAKRVGALLPSALIASAGVLGGASLAGGVTSHHAAVGSSAAAPATGVPAPTTARLVAAHRASRRIGVVTGASAGTGVVALMISASLTVGAPTPATTDTARPPHTSVPAKPTPQPSRPSPEPTAGTRLTPTPRATPDARPPRPRAEAAVPAVTAPRILTPASGTPTRQTVLGMTGTATPGSAVVATAYGREVGSTYAAVDGSWALSADVSALSDGTHTLAITSSHVGVSMRAEVTVRIDRHVSIPSDLMATRTASGVTVSGHADPFSRIQVRGESVDTTAVADATGAWSTTEIADLPAGYHPVTATAADEAGNVSPASAPLGIRID